MVWKIGSDKFFVKCKTENFLKSYDIEKKVADQEKLRLEIVFSKTESPKDCRELYQKWQSHIKMSLF